MNHDYNSFLCFSCINGILMTLGEGTSSYAFKGPSTDKVIKIMFNIDSPGLELMPSFTRKSNGQISYYYSLQLLRSSDTLDFRDSKETYETTKKIWNTLFKTELERLMYPPPELRFK